MNALFRWILVTALWAGSLASETDSVHHLRRQLAAEEWSVITHDTFEQGAGNFQLGSAWTNKFRCEGKYSLEIKDKQGSKSTLTLAQSKDTSSYDKLRVSFQFQGNGMDNDGDKFHLQYSPNGGSMWTTIKSYVKGSAAFKSNKACYSDSVVFDIAYTTTSKIRFQSESGSTDKSYIDNVKIEGRVIQKTPTSSPSKSPTEAPTSSPTSWEGICPRNKAYPPELFSVAPFDDSNLLDTVEDDFEEISSLAFSDLTDAQGNRFAYMVSDKIQLSLKVVKFTENEFGVGSPFRGAGETVAVYTLFQQPPGNGDWEDISLGPCTDVNTAQYSTDQVCIYIGDIGNNVVPRSVVNVYKFVEPAFGPNGPVSQTVTFANISFSYAGAGFNPAVTYDTEAMFVDWTGVPNDPSNKAGDIYIVIKLLCGGGVARIPVNQHNTIPAGGSTYYSNMPKYSVPPPQGIYDCSHPYFRVWTGADMRRDGRLIALIRNGPPAGVYFFARPAGHTVASAFSDFGCDYNSATSFGLRDEKQYEAVAFVDPTGNRFAEISECEGTCSELPAPGQSLYQHTLVYDYSDPSIVPSYTDGWVEIHPEQTFEGGNYGVFQSGGNRATIWSEYFLSTGENNCDGYCSCPSSSGGTSMWAVQLNETVGVRSSFYHSSAYSCNVYDLLRVSFDFKFRAFDHMDSLFLEISLDGGTNYAVVGTWAMDVPDLELGTLLLGQCYNPVVLLTPSQFRRTSFGDSVKLRFRNGANSGGDRCYVDNVRFEGHSVNTVL